MILELNQCGQSEEMLQIGVAEDRSVLGSPLSQDTQPYSIIDAVTGLRTFPCENCDKQFTDPSNLQRHIRSQHIGARSHACVECGKTFATSSGLKQHQHIHSSVKPFQCEVCLKAYTQFSNLCRHKRMHADCRQQIKCKDCGQAFSTMTSLSKHKRFCEGMLRPNGQQRISYPGMQGDAGSVTKAPSGLALMNATAQNPTSALASAYMNMYGPRPPFPFYPPFGGGAGFPLFPGAHPMAMGGHMGPVMTDSKLGGLTGSLGKAPGSPGASSLHGQTTELKREKITSEGSEADSSDVSSASDLDTSTGSDGDSEFSANRRLERSLLRAHLGSASSGVQIVNSHTRLAKSPLAASAPPAAHHSSASRDIIKRSPIRHDEDDDDDNAPFDLSKSSPPTPISFATSGDQPLDLSVRSRDQPPTPKTTPRKTHIFGSSGSSSASGSSRSSDGRRTPTSISTPLMPTLSSSSSRDTPPSPVSSMAPSRGERGLHYAYPTMASPVVIEPMYRVDKEKPQSYQDVVARMMAFGPRLPMHHTPLGFHGLSPSQHMGLLSPARPDAAKLLPPMLGKTPDHFSYNTSVNKLKERYACKFCGKVFPRSANLTRHLRTHTGEQPYKCKYCERSFSISSNLQRHVRNIHNKEKPFKCPLCDRCFGQQTNLDRHLKKHESDDPNMLDSPLPHEAELEEKDESYFDEIRNFIGKATADGGDEMNGIRPIGNIIDSHFSLTGQVVEKHTLDSLPSCEKRPHPADDLDDEDLDDLDEDLEIEDGHSISGNSSPSPKKARMENNNIKVEEPRSMNTNNGFHSEDDLEADENVLNKEEQHHTAHSPSLNGLTDPQHKAPLACSS